MRVLLDTTYFLPSIGVSLSQVPWDVVFRVRGGNEVFVSELTLFELSAKGAKYVNVGMIPAGNVVQGVNAILADEKITKVPFTIPQIMETAISLRKLVRDYLDCALLASAVQRCDLFLTEDTELLRKGTELDEVLGEINTEFTIKNWADAKRSV
jgi:PIN domain nuclease of toxin-antitoxin system